VQKHGNSVVAHVHEVLQFSVTKELGLQNYVTYPRTAVGEIGEKLRPYSIDRTGFEHHQISRLTEKLKDGNNIYSFVYF